MTKRSSIRLNAALVIGGILTALLIATALLSLVWTPEVPTRVRIALRLKGPLEAGLLGTDHFGRDVASLLMVGAWNSLAIAWPAVLLGAAIGTAIGCAAAAWKGIADEIAMRVSDAVFAFPAVLSAIMIGALVGSGPLAAILAIAVFNVPVFARVTRAKTGMLKTAMASTAASGPDPTSAPIMMAESTAGKAKTTSEARITISSKAPFRAAAAQPTAMPMAAPSSTAGQAMASEFQAPAMRSEATSRPK